MYVSPCTINSIHQTGEYHPQNKNELTVIK